MIEISAKFQVWTQFLNTLNKIAFFKNIFIFLDMFIFNTVLMKSKTYFTFICFLFFNLSGFANNIQISNIQLTGQDLNDQFTLIEFDVQWENSWRITVGPSNWDAAWIFVKYRQSGGEWQHASINHVTGDASSDGHAQPEGAIIKTPEDGTGIFIYRNSAGSGNVSFQGARLRWNYGIDGVNDEAIVDLKVFGIEMVYVPEGAFELGSPGGTENGKFYKYPGTNTVFEVTSENAIPVGASSGSLYYDVIGNSGDQDGPVPAAYPKGFSGFYCMKYEVSQEQWVAFFNCLTDNQKTKHDITGTSGKNNDGEVAGNGISWETGQATTLNPALPLNYVSWVNTNAYADWAGLRPMTELEYVKACRGNLPAVADEFAWGNANIYTTNYTLANEKTSQELVLNPGSGLGNAVYNETFTGRPLRVGILAASAVNKNREESGGSYYGIMDLSGNLYERVISIGHADGRSFTGQHGDGRLTIDGDANVAGWLAGGAGGGYIGGSYANGQVYIRIADRYDAATTSDLANSRVGFRAVRSAP